MSGLSLQNSAKLQFGNRTLKKVPSEKPDPNVQYQFIVTGDVRKPVVSLLQKEPGSGSYNHIGDIYERKTIVIHPDSEAVEPLDISKIKRGVNTALVKSRLSGGN